MRLKALIICVLLSLPALAQQQQYTKEQLESKRKEILESIKQTQEQLEATKKNKNATMGQLRALQAKLRARQRLIGNINQEIGQIANNIQQSSVEVAQLKRYLDIQKMRYAQSIRYAYENRSSYSMLAFLFSAKDFNDAVRRIKYLKKYRDYRKEQVNQIHNTQDKIEHKIGVLNNQKAQKDELLTAQEQQQQEIQKETEETNNVVKDLKGHEKQLMSEIEKNRRIAARVNRAINEVIKREIEIARKKAEEERKRQEEAKRKAEEEKKKAWAAQGGTLPSTSPTTNNNASGGTKTTNKTEVTVNERSTKPPPKKDAAAYNLNVTPEAAALASSFESNKGKLPWPVAKGFISDPFGVHQHPVEEKVMINNFGVDIRTTPNAVARAVFNGQLTHSFYIPGSGWTVIISHGRYYTVYCGLESVTAKKGEEVHTKEPIGVVGNNDEGEPTINFQIWKDNGGKEPLKLDPADWIAR